MEYKITMGREYGFLDKKTKTYIVFRGINSLKQAGVLYLESIFSKEENEPVFTDGKFDVKATMQTFIDDYGKSVIECMDEEPLDDVIVCVEDAVSHLINLSGMLIVDLYAMHPKMLNEILNDIAIEWQIKDYEHHVSI